MGKLEEALKLIGEGVSNSREIARRMGISVEEVEGIIKILESMGYVEKVEFGSPSCDACPLKKICPGSCVHFKGEIYQLRKSSEHSEHK